MIYDALRRNESRCYVIDDSTYLMQLDNFRHAQEKGFDKFVTMAVSFETLLEAAMATSDDTTVYFMFKAFLSRLEDSNEHFDVGTWQRGCDERALVGLALGIVLQYEDYTNESGEDKERLQVVGVYSVADIRSGDYRLPERKDSRKGEGVAAPTAADALPSLPAYDDLGR